MGGSITLKLLETHPERLLSVTSGGSTGFRASDTTEQWDSAFVKKLVAGEPLSQAMLETAPPDYAKLGGRPVPTLLIVGEQDNPGRFAELRAAMPAAEFVVVPGARHGSVPDAAQFLAALRSFLQRHDQR